MRTSFDLDDDLLEKLKRLAVKQHSSMRKVLNEVLRAGFAKQQPRRVKRRPYAVRTFRSAFRPGVDALKLNQLVDELDTRKS